MSGRNSKNGIKRKYRAKTYHKICQVCNEPFESKSHNAKYCSDECILEHLRPEVKEGVEGIDYIVCPVCGRKCVEITIQHIKMHGYDTAEEFKKKFGLTKLKCQKKCDKMVGDKNPGFQHGGRLSPWSEKSGSTPEEIAEAKRKAKENYTSEKRDTTIQYWMNKGFSEEEARKKISARQRTFTKQKCIEKYGEEEGLKVWQARQEKWMASLAALPEEEKIRINKLKCSSGYIKSKPEIALFKSLAQVLSEIESQMTLFANNRSYVYDIRLGKKIIELYGDFWHHNPTKYSTDWVNPYTKKTSQEKWEFDAIKNKVATDQGFEVMIIWESEYKNNYDGTIQKCLAFLNS